MVMLTRHSHMYDVYQSSLQFSAMTGMVVFLI